MSSFKVGQQVVCIATAADWYREGGGPAAEWEDVPKKGEVCIIRGFGSLFNNGDISLRLEGYRWSYSHCAFRPIVNQLRGMGMLRGLLEPKKEKALARG